jgi:tRNA (Thr-GGU) A37 N-methylase
VVRSAHTEPETTPIQAALNRAGRGTIEIAEAYREGLAGLDGFGYAWLLTWLHQPGGPPPGGRAGTRRSGRCPICCAASSGKWGSSRPGARAG